MKRVELLSFFLPREASCSGTRPTSLYDTILNCLSMSDPQLFLGMYPEEHFIEKPVKEAMIRFRKNLEAIVSVIAERNKNKKLPYYYLSPDRIPNSVAI